MSSALHGNPTIVHLLAFLVVMATGTRNARALDIGRCATALGMQTGDILDSALSASSSLDPANVGPDSARIRSEIKGGAWCPKQQISKDSYEFLEIDLGRLHVITLVETQGRFGNGQGQEYTEQFRLEYQRETDGKWFRYKSRRGQEIIQGNMNTHTAEMREILPPIIALKIRFIPHSTHPKSVCLRVELYGCLWKDGVVSYDMPQGEHRGIDLNFVDASYDGDDDNGFLSGGLGQLFDGEEGQSNFRLDLHNLGQKGYEWVGWKNESFPTGFIEIEFKFDSIRNFTSVSLHCSNTFSRDVRVFSTARVFFSGLSQSEDEFDPTPVEFEYVRDGTIDFSRFVTIPLENNVGKFVKIRLQFDARWMMISEVQFTSEPIVVESSGLSVSPSGEVLLTTSVREEVLILTDSIPVSRTTKQINGLNNSQRQNPSDSHLVSNNFDPNVTLETDSVTSLWNASRTQNKNKNGIDDESVVILITILVVVVLTLCAVIVVFAFKRTKYNCVHRFHQPSKTNKTPPSVIGDGCDSSFGPRLITYSQNSGLLKPNVPIGHQYLTPSCHHDSDEQEQSDTTSPLINAPQYVSPYATVDILKLFEFQNSEQASRFCTVPRKPMRSQSVRTDFPRDNLKFIRSMGQAPTGEVYLCELVPKKNESQFGSHNPNRTLTSRLLAKSSVVAVKVIGRNTSDQAREDFQREASALSRLNDPNVIQLLGVSANSDPCFVVLEYPCHGNLKDFLQNCTVEGAVKTSHKNYTLSCGCLIYMASQIASGMKFLESNNLIHRDLAARNCLLGDDYMVKISDFGNGPSQFPSDYYTSPGTVPLPVRWIAWEALRLSNFSTKSDIWSFAVTMWELLTCGLQPYDSLTDEQVIVNSNHLLQNPRLWVALEQPASCPREIYDLLCHCWSRDKSERPTFHEVHMFLQRNNAGYHPSRDRCLITGVRSKASASLLV